MMMHEHFVPDHRANKTAYTLMDALYWINLRTLSATSNLMFQD
jgi:hypothetical protein